MNIIEKKSSFECSNCNEHVAGYETCKDTILVEAFPYLCVNCFNKIRPSLRDKYYSKISQQGDL